MQSTLWLVVTRTCNLACGYCYQTDSSHRREVIKRQGNLPIMSKSVADKALPWAVRWAPAGGLRVNLYGGEPLLAWPLIRSIVPEWEAAFKEAGKDLRFSITTNGALLKPEVREFMDAHGIGMLLSLDGPPDAHNAARPLKGGGPSWEAIDPEGLLKWRPELEVAWTLAPAGIWHADMVDDLIGRGFKRINFNLDFISDWPHEAQQRLLNLGKRVGRRIAEGKLLSNWESKYIKAGTVDTKMERPCGLATGMLALTPEGHLFPSQEMAFTVYEEGRAPGTPETYKVGDLANTPVLDPFAQARVGLLKTEDMRTPIEPETGRAYDCNDCIAKSACIGGCHCRYVGMDGQDPTNRMDIPAGHCPSMRNMMTGLIMGHWIARKLRPTPSDSKPPPSLPDVAKLKF